MVRYRLVLASSGGRRWLPGGGWRAHEIKQGSQAVVGQKGTGSGNPGESLLLLRIAAVTIFVFPSNMVVDLVGAVGTVPMMAALLLFILWISSVCLGLHDPLPFGNPGRIGLAMLWLASCASYVALYSGLTGGSEAVNRAAADRWLILILASSGLILVGAECVRSLNDALVIVRSLLAGGSFCCIVALIQFSMHVNPMEWIQQVMPGFVDNGGNTPFQTRGALTRVAGSTFHSIELGVVAAMLLPLSIWRGLHDPKGRKALQWLGTALLVFAVAATVSRSGVLGLLAGLIVFLPFMTRPARRWAAVVFPTAIGVLFLTVPGLISTLTESFSSAGSDPSISTRTDNLPRVVKLIAEHPLVGLGPGNYIPTNALEILDNQYLNSAVTLGIPGFFCIVAYLMLPGLSGVAAARAAVAQPLKCLVGAVAAAGVVSGVCSFTFDSLAFPVFALTYAILVGLSGSLWILVKKESMKADPSSGASLRTASPDRKG